MRSGDILGRYWRHNLVKNGQLRNLHSQMCRYAPLGRPSHCVRIRRYHPPDRGYARCKSICCNIASNSRRLSRLAFVGRRNAKCTRGLAPGVTPEMAAAVSKICRAQDLLLIAAKCTVITRFRNTVGLPGRLSVRLQPNHPTDDPRGIAASILDGLMLGAGDAVIGINPATDSPERAYALLSMLDEVRAKLDIPTQTCVLAHITTTSQSRSAAARQLILCFSRLLALKPPIALRNYVGNARGGTRGGVVASAGICR